MFIIASDGATKGQTNKLGLPTVASYGITASDGYYDTGVEIDSTNQRGELLGCLAALEYAKSVLEHEAADEVALLFDSAYIANALKQRWFGKWMGNGWKTSTGGNVKNKDLWVRIANLFNSIDEDCLLIYQIKGHTTVNGPKSMEKCRQNFIENNGGLPPEEVLHELIRLNNLADSYAGDAAERAWLNLVNDYNDSKEL